MYRVTAFQGKTVGLFDQIKGLLGGTRRLREAFVESAETTVERRKRPRIDAREGTTRADHRRLEDHRRRRAASFCARPGTKPWKHPDAEARAGTHAGAQSPTSRLFSISFCLA